MCRRESPRRYLYGGAKPAGGVPFNYDIAQLPFGAGKKKRASVYNGQSLVMIRGTNSRKASGNGCACAPSRKRSSRSPTTGAPAAPAWGPRHLAQGRRGRSAGLNYPGDRQDRRLRPLLPGQPLPQPGGPHWSTPAPPSCTSRSSSQDDGGRRPEADGDGNQPPPPGRRRPLTSGEREDRTAHSRRR